MLKCGMSLSGGAVYVDHALVSYCMPSGLVLTVVSKGGYRPRYVCRVSSSGFAIKECFLLQVYAWRTSDRYHVPNATNGW